MSNKSLKSSPLLRAHMTYFRRPSHHFLLNSAAQKSYFKKVLRVHTANRVPSVSQMDQDLLDNN